MAQVMCGNQDCLTTFEDDPNAPAEARKPCPACGAISRRLTPTIESNIPLKSQLRFKAKGRRRGKMMIFIEGVVGDSFFRKTGTLHVLKRTIDREHDHYEEVVTDPQAGQIIHECREPLSKHTGHADDKKNCRSH